MQNPLLDFQTPAPPPSGAFARDYAQLQKNRQRQAEVDRRAGQRALDLQYLERDRTGGEIATDTGLGLAGGAFGLVQSGFGLANMATLGGLEAVTGLSDDFRAGQQAIQGAKTDQLQFQQVQADKVFEEQGILAGIANYATSPALMGDLVSSNVASIIPTVAAAGAVARASTLTAAARGLTADQGRREAARSATNAATGVGAAQAGGSANVEAFNQAIDEGLSEREATLRALGAGVATGAATAGISRIPGIGAAGQEAAAGARAAGVAGAASVGRDLANATRAETTEEFFQSGTEQFIQNASSTQRELFDDVAKSASLGGLGGAGIGFGLGLVRAPSQLRSQVDAALEENAQAADAPEVGTTALEQAGASKVEQQFIDEELARLGANKRPDGAVVVQDDILGEQVFASGREAVEFYSEEVSPGVVPQDPNEEDSDAIERSVWELPTVDEGDESINIDQLPLDNRGVAGLPDVASEVDNTTPLGRARNQLRDVFNAGEPRQRAGVRQYPVENTDTGEVDYIGEREALRLAAQLPGVNREDVGGALSALDAIDRAPAAPARSGGETPATGITEAELLAEEDAVLQQEGFTDAGNSLVQRVNENGELTEPVSRRDALDSLGYIPEGNDLLGSAEGTASRVEPKVTEKPAPGRPGIVQDELDLGIPGSNTRPVVRTDNGGRRRPSAQTPPERTVTEADLLTAEDAALQETGFHENDDGTVQFVATGADGLPEVRTTSRETALQMIEFLPPGNDLLGEQVTSPFTAADSRNAFVESVPSPDPSVEGQLKFVFDADVARAAGAAKLQELADLPLGLTGPTAEGLSAIEQQQAETQHRAAWERVLQAGLELVNSRIPNSQKKISLKAPANRSRTLRAFVDDAIAEGVDPNSTTAFDYIAERAQIAESSTAQEAQVLGGVAEIAGRQAPALAPLSDWKKQMARRGIAKPGQMKGAAFQQFKDLVGKATIRPSGSEFDAFMQQFSDVMPEAAAKTPFGKAVREVFPAAEPAAKPAAKPKAKAKPKKKPKAEKTPLVEEVQYTPEEAALVTPADRLPPNATEADKTLNKAKRDRVKARDQAPIEAAEAADALDTEVQALRETKRKAETATPAPAQRELVDESDGTVDDDPDALRAEQELPPIVEPAREPLSADQTAAVERAKSEFQIKVTRLTDILTNQYRQLLDTYLGTDTRKDRRDPREERDAVRQDVAEGLLERRFSALSKALDKDSTDITTWGAMVAAMIQSDVLTDGKVGAAVRYNSFVKPALDRFNTVLDTAAFSPDRAQIYRDMLVDTGLLQVVDSLGGQFTQQAQVQLANIAQRTDGLIEANTSDPANASNTKVHKSVPTKGKKGKFSLAPASPETPMARADLDAMVRKWNDGAAKGEKNIEVFGTVAEAQRSLGVAIPSSANGVYYNGRATVIAENIENADAAYEVAVHERTHGGLEGLLGTDRLPAVMNRMWANPQLRKRIRKKMGGVATLSRQEAAEEVLVEMAVNGETLNKSLFSKIRAAIGRFSSTVLGINDLVLSDRAVNDLLRDTADYLRGTKSELSMNESYVDNLQIWNRAINGDSVMAGPKFSTATEALDDFAESGQPTDMARLSAATRGALQESVGQNLSAKAKGQAVTTARSARTVALGFMPLSQIDQLYRGLFTTTVKGSGAVIDHLKNLRNRKQAKQQKFNRVLNESGGERAVYRNPDGTETPYTGSPAELARRWQDVTLKRSDQAQALDIINQDGTFFKLHPDRPMDKQAKLKYENNAQTFTKAERAQAFTEIQAAWNKLTPESKQIYRDTQATYSALWAERVEAIKGQTGRMATGTDALPDPGAPETLIGTGEWKTKMDKRAQIMLNRLSQGPYSPLARFGEFFVVAKDSQGKVVYSTGHDTASEAEMVRISMEKSVAGRGFTVALSKRGQFDAPLDGLSKLVYDRLQVAMDAAFPGADPNEKGARNEALTALTEVYLQSLPDSNLLTSANARKNVGGATMDSFRAFNDYISKSARALASLNHDHEIQESLAQMSSISKIAGSGSENIRRAEVLDAVKKQHRESQSFQNNKFSEMGTQVSFMAMMTSASQLFLNASQTALVTLPRLSVKYGIGATSKFIGEASAAFARTGTKGMHSESGGLVEGSALQRLMANLKQDGTLDFSLAHDISDMAQRGSDLAHSRLGKASQAAAFFIHKSEVFNREVAAYTVLRGEMKNEGVTEEQFAQWSPEKQDEAMARWTDVAKDAVLETQFDYSQANKASSTQGPVARVVFQFQQFRLNMLGMMAKDVRDSMFRPLDSTFTAEDRKTARKTLLYMQGMQLMMTGATGSILAPVAFALMDMFDDEDEISSTKERFLQSGSPVLATGLLGGLLDTQRFGFQSLLPVIGGFDYAPTTDDPKELLENYAVQALGPTMGLASRYVSGVNSLANGDFEKGAEALLPGPFRDAYRALVSERNGDKDSKGIPFYQPTTADTVMNLVGLRTANQAANQADRGAIYSGIKRASDRRSKLIGRVVTASSFEERQEAMADVQKWNQYNRGDLVIENSIIKQAKKRRGENIRAAAEFGVPNDRIPGQLKDLTNADR